MASVCGNSCREGNLIFAADKACSTCSPREIRDVLLLSKKLWQNHSPSLNLVRYSLIVIG